VWILLLRLDELLPRNIPATHIYEYSGEDRPHALSCELRLYKTEVNTTLKRSVTNFKFTSDADSTILLISLD
jgi:hypothetical protein